MLGRALGADAQAQRRIGVHRRQRVPDREQLPRRDAGLALREQIRRQARVPQQPLRIEPGGREPRGDHAGDDDQVGGAALHHDAAVVPAARWIAARIRG